MAGGGPTKGIIVGTVFERAAFIPHGAYFYISSFDDKRIMLESGRGGGKQAIVNKAPKVPKGVGSPFALQLPPEKTRSSAGLWITADASKCRKATSRPSISSPDEGYSTSAMHAPIILRRLA